jgi:hypothetical protein
MKIFIIFQSLKEHIDTLVEAEEQIDDEEGENNPEELVLGNKIEWKPQMDALLRYGSWLTSTRKFYCHRVIGEIPGNFVGKLLLHLANSRYNLEMYIFITKCGVSVLRK